MSNKNIVSIDIDGVLNNYPDCWLLYLNDQQNRNFESISHAKSILDKSEYDIIKNRYRLNGEISKYTKPNKEMIEVVNTYYNSGFEVIISTSRPINSPNYPLLFEQTEKWLSDQNIKFSQLIFKDEKLSNHTDLINHILFHIDDEFKYIKSFKNFNVTAYLFKSFNQYSSEISCEELVEKITKL